MDGQSSILLPPRCHPARSATSTGDFKPALEQLLGEDASGLSPTTIARMSKEWEEHHDRFSKRHLGFSRYAYLFMDGIHVSVRLGEDPKVCLLIVIGVREDGEKELLAVEDGYRESTESWAGVFRDMKRRGLNEPKLVVGDGALGAWAALRDVFPGAGEQRCWFHASGNIIDCLPKRLHSGAKGLLSEIMVKAGKGLRKTTRHTLQLRPGAQSPRCRFRVNSTLCRDDG